MMRDFFLIKSCTESFSCSMYLVQDNLIHSNAPSPRPVHSTPPLRFMKRATYNPLGIILWANELAPILSAPIINRLEYVHPVIIPSSVCYPLLNLFLSQLLRFSVLAGGGALLETIGGPAAGAEAPPSFIGPLGALSFRGACGWAVGTALP